MSYSFSFQAANKAEAKKAVEAALEGMVAQQPIHARDKAAALANASAVIDLLVDDPDLIVSVNLNGYVGWRDVLSADGSNPLATASISASASLVVPEAKKPD